MRTLNDAADAALRRLAEPPRSAGRDQAGEQVDEGAAGSAREHPFGTTSDVPSFTVEALPAETFEALVIVASWLGDVLDDEQPYRLDADLGLDHWWDPVGIRLGLAYWGDNDTLDSTDFRASLYWRGKGFSIAGDYEFRDFSFLLPATDRFSGREIGFDANGIGLTARFDVTDKVTIGVSGMAYDYSVNLKLDDNRRLLDLLSFSRLSLINSLIDYRAYATLGLDVGKSRWQVDVGTWKGEVDSGVTRSATVRFLNPLSETADIEFALGMDDSDLYGTVTIFSVFLYFYGGV